MPKPTKKSRKLGLWMPRKIQKETRLSWQGKCLYAFFWSFGARGCWMTNEQIGKEWGRSSSAIKVIISNLNKAGLLDILAGNSKYRKIYAKDHPARIAYKREYAIRKAAEDKKILLARKQPGTNKQQQQSYSVESNPVEGHIQPGNRAVLNPVLIKNTIKKTIKHGEPSPLPAEGQAQASPQRQKPTKDEQLRNIKLESELEQQKKLVFGARPVKPSMSEAEFASRRELQRKAMGV